MDESTSYERLLDELWVDVVQHALYFLFQMHIEAAKLLQFSEEEFVKGLDWGS